MSHSYVSALFHCVFSTKHRRKSIRPKVQDRLWAFMGGIARNHGMKPLAVGGVEDHAHLLLSLPRTMEIAKAMQLIKGASSGWIHTEFPECKSFAWQGGYGAFSIGISQLDDTRRYIARQEEHHRKLTFQEEFVAMLKRHGIEFDADEIWR